MERVDVVLIALYDLDSLSVRTLHAVLEKAGVSVRTIFLKQVNANKTMDTPTDDEINILVKLVKEFAPLLVGISVRSTLFNLASKITEAIKKEVDTLVIWGGIHPTVRPVQSLEFADIVCIGEGEEAIVELAAKLTKGEGIENVQALWIKNGDKIIRNELRPLIQNLDSIPFPDFSNENKFLVDIDSSMPILPAHERSTRYWLMTSRGCPFRCTYCNNNIVRRIHSGKGKYLRRRSVENVIDELVFAKKRSKNLLRINFLDDIFTFDVDWIREFGDEYKKAVNLPFSCYCHPQMTNEEVIRILKDVGVTDMTMGIQAGSEKIRHEYFERYDTNEQIIRAAHTLHKYRIYCYYDVIMDNPLETNEDMRETFNLLLRLPRPFGLHTQTLTHFPDTKLTKLLLERGIISENDVEDKKEQAYERWSLTLDLRRDKQNLFWDNLYYLTTKRYVPRKFVIWLSHVNFLKMHPKPMTLFLRLTSPNIQTVNQSSKIDMARWYIMMGFWSPHLLFEKRAWLFLLRIMMKSKLLDVSLKYLKP